MKNKKEDSKTTFNKNDIIEVLADGKKDIKYIIMK